MSKSGFIQLPRSFYDDPIWQSFSLEERSIFMTIVINAAWEETIQNDFGIPVTVKPGQLLMTQRALISEAFPPTNDPKLLNKYKSSVVRALAKFKKVNFSYHETYHKKTLHTIVRSDILEKLVPKPVPNSYQTRTLKEEVKKKEKKEKLASCSIHFSRDLSEFIGITEKDRLSWKNVYPQLNLDQELLTMRTWLLSEKGQNRQGARSFIDKWLKQSETNRMSNPHKIIDPGSNGAEGYTLNEEDIDPKLKEFANARQY